MKCWRETLDWLDENLWLYDAEPDPGRIEKVLQVYLDDWRGPTLHRYEPFLSRYQEALQTEFEQDAARARAKAAKQRRAGIKAIN